MIADNSEKYLKMKVLLAKLSGVAVLIVSMIFSQTGFGFSEPGMAYAGWILAIAVTVAELIFNTRVKSLNWTIVFVGIMAYLYSIWTNLIGFYALKGTVMALDQNLIIPLLGSIFLDVYPEMALAWAMGASSEGDLIGNVVEVSQDQNSLFKHGSTGQTKSQPRRESQLRVQNIPASIPRRGSGNNLPQSSYPKPSYPRTPDGQVKYPAPLYHPAYTPDDLDDIDDEMEKLSRSLMKK